ncbi:patatin-like phospholipase family protein [Bradyrhizobium tropiciagri]|uniref:patatin-like phospholipase family protein n=1 Tax=Bradyrhizobium tropiciagri TaxID=312253 RepID=UPI001BA9E124|nr:patatin-like phospholipase family protein [Bradyrhizobium tropiciagri]MBR0896807.1 patatin-like phospholipase family protein [Bradyrhizobium tropiciagri]
MKCNTGSRRDGADPPPAGAGRRIGLAFSGGGVRAAVFHTGVLKRLAQENLLEEVSAVSTVSGGSLVMAAIVSLAGMRWPSSEEYLRSILPTLRGRLTTTDLFSAKAIGWRGLIEFNAGLFSDRAHVLAQLLERNWGVAGKLADLPDMPAWSINTTCLETGKNWRFAKREMGDWNFGRHFTPDLALSTAAAASAAVPYVIGAVTVPLPADGWWETDPATGNQVRTRPPPHRSVRLWDGGAYDNMGLEALCKPGRGLKGCDFLICSDASGPLRQPERSPLAGLIQGRLSSSRMFDVAGDQIRALRSRMLIADIAAGAVAGVLLRMGNSVRAVDVKSGRVRPAAFYDAYQADETAAKALQHATDLKAISPGHFDALARHGFEIADATLTTYVPAGFPRSLSWEDPA